jgi:hypothetical protein
METDWSRTDAQTCSGCMTKLLILAAIVRAARLAELAGVFLSRERPASRRMKNIAYFTGSLTSTPAVPEHPIAERNGAVPHQA